MSDEIDDIEMMMETNDDSTEVKIIFKSVNEITLNDLILTLECYLTELTRAESDKRKTGTEVH